MEGLETSHHMYEEFPNILLWEIGVAFGVFYDFEVEVASVRVLHDDAQGLAVFFKEGLFVRNDVRVSE